MIGLSNDRVCGAASRTTRFFAAILFGLLFVLAAIPAFAEGSRTLYPATYPAAGSRADLDLTGAANLYGGVTARRQFLYVYANAGEYILLGSSNRANGGDISVYNPQSFGTKAKETIPGTASFSCAQATPPAGSFSGGALGQIVARANELAGPNSADNSATVSNGYAPCAYLAPSSGIYGVLFSVATSGGNGPTGSIATLHVGSATVAAWDLSVRANATTTTDINARVFTYGFVAFTGNNGLPVYHTLYYATLDGSRYQQSMQGLDPNGYALWGNASGFLDNGQPLYKDIRGSNALVNTGIAFGTGAELTAQPPQTPIFFSSIDPAGANAGEVTTVLQKLGIPLTPPTPQLINPVFQGLETGNATYVGGGGTFTFSALNDTSYQIVISAGVDFDPANVANATLSGLAPDGNNSVLWNGLANNGTAFPTGTFTFQIVGRNGEIHFPIIDAEGNKDGGPILTKLNGISVGDHTAYYDDRGYVTRNNQPVGTLNGRICANLNPTQVVPTPDHSLLGQDSSASTFSGANCNDGGGGTCYYRYWPGHANTSVDCDAGTLTGFGDAKGLDTWTYQLSTVQTNTVVIDAPPTAATVATTVTVPATAYPGTTVNGTFTFQNVGGTSATGVTYTAVVGTPGNCPTNFAIPALPSGVTFNYNTSTCALTLIGMPTTLTPGQGLNFNFSYTAPPSGTVPATTTINSGNGGSATATGVTQIIVADVTTTITVPAAAANGSTVSGTIVYTNAPAATATANGVTYTATIGTPGSCPAGVTFPTLPPNVSASYDTSSCIVTFSGSGLPASLAPGDSLNIGFQYTGPSNGTVPVSSGITTTTPESNTANNTSSGSTVFAAQPNITLTKAGPATAVQGTAFNYTLNLGNSGAAASATTVTVQDILPPGVTGNSASPGVGVSSVSCVSLPSAPGATITCTVNLAAALAAGAANGVASFSVNATAANTGSITNYAAVDPSGGTNPPTPGPTCAPATSCGNAPTTVNAPVNITLTKSGPATVLTNGTLAYGIALGNSGGTASGTTLTVTDVLPAGVSYVGVVPGTNVTSVNCTGSTTITCTVNLTAALAAGVANGAAAFTINTTAPATSGSITNYAAVDPSGGTNPPTPGPTCAPAASCGSAPTTIITPPNLGVSKTANGPWTVGQTTPAPGYTLTVTNSGGSASSGTITVKDLLPAGLTAPASFSSGTWSCATVAQNITCTSSTILAASNGSSTIAIPVAIAAAAVPSVINNASVGGGGDPNNGSTPPTPGSCATGDNHCGNVTTPVVAKADLVVTKVANPASTYVPGQSLNYTITVTNNGPSGLAGISVSDTVPATVSVSAWVCTATGGSADCDTAAAGTGASGSSNTIALNNVSLPNGASISIAVTGTAQSSATGSIVNSVTATPPVGTTCTTPPCDRTATVTNTNGGTPQLKIVKSSTTSTFTVGQNGAYSLLASNIGTSSTTGTITVSDTLPSGVSTTALPSGSGWDCSTSTATQVTCTTTAVLAPNGSAPTINVPVTIATGTPSPVTNTATLSGGGDPSCPSQANANCSSTISTPVDAPILQILKTGPATAVPGGQIVYSITVSNIGTAAANNAILTDPAPTGLTYVSIGSPCTALPCNLGTLIPGQTVTITALTFSVATNFTGSILNTASIVSDETTQSSSSASTVVQLTVPAVPVPLDARWMSLLLGLLLAFGGFQALRVIRR